ncbi:MAG: M20/M25/M40 family metallo-hydrolase [Proteobacteria bacterium]|nr:M20/M25/M40 family metallo-hydrolase [Pseudomonadota bacterium]
MKTDATNQPIIDADEILDGIRQWVEVESPSHDAVAVNRMADMVATDLRAIGAAIERTPGRDGYGDVLKARMPWGGDGPGILVLSHIDTVHPIGLLAGALKFRREGDSVYAPGIYDMKGGAYLAYYALRHLVRSGQKTPLPVTFMFIPEEEVGSPTSRAAIEAAARRAKYVLVTEPARDGGKIVTARKGVARFDVHIKGRPAHSGVRHEDGRSAIREMARQILAIEAMTDYARGVTTNVGLIAGGTGVNVVPAECTAGVDMRVPDMAISDEMCAKVLGLKAVDPDVKLTIAGGLNRPPYGKNEGIAKLFEHAKQLAKEIGFELKDTPLTGGGSDGNFTAALGIPTLDGLGVDGKGAHTDYEQAYYSSLVPRTKLMLRLLETLK